MMPIDSKSLHPSANKAPRLGEVVSQLSHEASLGLRVYYDCTTCTKSGSLISGRIRVAEGGLDEPPLPHSVARLVGLALTGSTL